MDKQTAITVDKSAITRTRLAETDRPALADGAVLLSIDSFALTTNNVTYAATGAQLRYWDFFPSGTDGWGIVPVWGFATVEESRCPDIEPGERLYGYFPMASHLVVLPGRIREASFADVSPHRADLAATYNTYIRLGAETGDDRALEDKRAILYPLYATSYLLFDFLSDNDWFGAEQIIIGSASSKTGIGLGTVPRRGSRGRRAEDRRADVEGQPGVRGTARCLRPGS